MSFYSIPILESKLILFNITNVFKLTGVAAIGSSNLISLVDNLSFYVNLSSNYVKTYKIFLIAGVKITWHKSIHFLITINGVKRVSRGK